MIYGAMLAGGSGTRVKSSKIPKQFIEIGGKPIIIYTLENMLKVKRFDYIYIAVHKDYEDYMNEQVKKNIPESEKVIMSPPLSQMITEFMMTMLSLSTIP